MADLQLAITKPSGALDMLTSSDGSAWQATTLALDGRWPSFNPTRDLIACSRVEVVSGQPRSYIDLLNHHGQRLRTVYESPAGIAPVIAARVPHYFSWSPGGNMLAFVAQGQFGLTLHVSDIDGVINAEPIINGAPLFISWCTDNNFLAVHSGQELAVVETEGSRVTAEVAPRALGFRTPAYSDDAEVLAYAVPGEPGVAIMRALFQGTSSREVRRFPGGTALAFRPNTQELTVAVTRDPESGAFGELWSVDLAQEGAPARRLLNSAFVSFAWSPVGDRFYVAVPLQTGDGRYQFVVRDAEGHFLAATEPFIPSLDLRTYLGFFDQYTISHHLWSPDGQMLVLSGRMPGDGPAPSFADSEGDFIYTWRPERQQPLVTVARGDIAFFPPLERPVVGRK